MPVTKHAAKKHAAKKHAAKKHAAKKHAAKKPRRKAVETSMAFARPYFKLLAAKFDNPFDWPFYVDTSPLDLFIDPNVIPADGDPPSHDLPQSDRKGKIRSPATDTHEPATQSFTSFVGIAGPPSNPRRILVVGKSGQGKTFLLNWTAVSLAKRALQRPKPNSRSCDELIPVLVKLEDLARYHPGAGESWDIALQEAICRELWPPNSADVLPTAFLEGLRRHLKGEQCWLLLDGLDEVVDYESVRWVFKVLEKWSCHVIVTSCQFGVRSNFPYETVQLAPFAWPHIKKFVTRRFPSEDKQQAFHRLELRQSSLSYFLDSPFLLSLLCWVLEQTGALAAGHYVTATRVYEELLNAAMSSVDDHVTLPHKEHSRPLLKDLAHLAWTAFQETPGTNTLSAHLVQNAITAHVLNKLRALGILVPRLADRSTYELPHRIFVDFLAAMHLADELSNGTSPDREELLAFINARMLKPEWHQMIVFATGLLPKPAPLLALATDPSCDDVRRNRHAVAVRMILEVEPNKRVALKPLIQSIISTELAEWHKRHQVHRAPYPLTIVLQLISQDLTSLDDLIRRAKRLAPVSVDPERLERQIRGWAEVGMFGLVAEGIARVRDSSGQTYICPLIEGSLRFSGVLAHSTLQEVQSIATFLGPVNDASAKLATDVPHTKKHNLAANTRNAEKTARTLEDIIAKAKLELIGRRDIGAVAARLNSADTQAACDALAAVQQVGRPLLEPAVVSAIVRHYASDSSCLQTQAYWAVIFFESRNLYFVRSPNGHGWSVCDIDEPGIMAPHVTQEPPRRLRTRKAPHTGLEQLRPQQEKIVIYLHEHPRAGKQKLARALKLSERRLYNDADRPGWLDQLKEMGLVQNAPGGGYLLTAAGEDHAIALRRRDARRKKETVTTVSNA